MPLSENPSGRELAAFADEVHSAIEVLGRQGWRLEGHPEIDPTDRFRARVWRELCAVSPAIDWLAQEANEREARASEVDATYNSVTLNGEVWDLVAGGHWRRRIDSDEVLDPPTWTLVVGPGRKAKFNQSTHVVTVK